MSNPTPNSDHAMTDNTGEAMLVLKPCPPHSWAHAPTVGYFSCMNCRERVNYDDPRYAEILAERDAAIAALRTPEPSKGDAVAMCAHCCQPERAHEPSGCCGDGGGSTFATLTDGDRLHD